MRAEAVEMVQAPAVLADLVRQVIRGGEVTLTEGGEPVARITPVAQREGPRVFGSEAPVEEFFRESCTVGGWRMNRREKKPEIVQLRNPRSGRYVKVDRTHGRIVDHKRSEGPYKNVPIVPLRKVG